jgi:hypothetical protein
MARSQQQLQSERQTIIHQTEALQATLIEQYSKYCQSLGESCQKQLIIAAYQICTQIYPESFLKLTFNQRDKLQAQLRELSVGIGKHLLDTIQQTKPSLPHAESSEQAIALAPPTLIPEQVALWCRQQEKNIAATLESTSQSANRLLQQFQIIPSQLPPKLLEIAMKAEGDSPGQTANILDLLVEARNTDEDDEDTELDPPSPIKITAIHLRLTEIEFNDGQLTLLHKAIYQSLEQLSQLHQRYERNQKDMAIAGAEAAWRSSWREDS